MNIAKYPEGYDAVKNDMLAFLPEDEEVRSEFMTALLQWMVQW